MAYVTPETATEYALSILKRDASEARLTGETVIENEDGIRCAHVGIMWPNGCESSFVIWAQGGELCGEY